MVHHHIHLPTWDVYFERPHMHKRSITVEMEFKLKCETHLQSICKQIQKLQHGCILWEIGLSYCSSSSSSSSSYHFNLNFSSIILFPLLLLSCNMKINAHVHVLYLGQWAIKNHRFHLKILFSQLLTINLS